MGARSKKLERLAQNPDILDDIMTGCTDIQKSLRRYKSGKKTTIKRQAKTKTTKGKKRKARKVKRRQAKRVKKKIKRKPKKKRR